MSLLETCEKYPAHDTDLEYESDTESENEYSLSAQQQWEESIRVITELINHMLFPLLGKLVGRRVAHSVWRRVAEYLF